MKSMHLAQSDDNRTEGAGEMGMTPRVTWFDEATRKKIVAESMEILEKVGVFVENDEAIEMLAGAGAKVEGGRMMIPSTVVEKALETAPSRIRVYDRSGEVAMDLGEDRIHFNPGSAALRIFDPELGDARIPVTADVIKYALSLIHI